ncbi:MAG: response regulator [Planctomycetes bacterium]|nr:response regulator [Planctomycetota bacterium]
MIDDPLVLVIEDDPPILHIIAFFLRQAGFRVEGARFAEEGIASARRTPPSLILLDLTLPDLDGLTAAALLREDPRLADVPILLVSGQAADELRVKAAITGAVDFLAKPFTRADLVRRARRWTAARAGSATHPPKPDDILLG